MARDNGENAGHCVAFKLLILFHCLVADILSKKPNRAPTNPRWYHLRYARTRADRVLVKRGSLHNKLILGQAFGKWGARGTTDEIGTASPCLLIDFRVNTHVGEQMERDRFCDCGFEVRFSSTLEAF